MSTTSRARRWRRAVTTLSLVTAGLLAGAGIASAHVSVNPSEAAAGDYTKLTFRVPNESPTAGTVAITVALPPDHPFASVSVRQIPGWKVIPEKTTLPVPVTEGDLTIKEAVTSITWTADAGTEIGPGEFAEFDISVGPVPDVGSLNFPTTQTYNDGTVVNWDEPTSASGEEPEHPAPALTVGDGAGEQAGEEAGHSHSDEAAGSAAETEASVATAASSSPTTGASTTATVLAVIGLVVAAAALVVAAVALRRRPGGPTTPPREG
ncbi:YcnI family copper-binding membrane protein [Nakamurella sp. GG22]